MTLNRYTAERAAKYTVTGQRCEVCGHLRFPNREHSCGDVLAEADDQAALMAAVANAGTDELWIAPWRRPAR